MKIATIKTNVMAFKETEHVRSKLVTYNDIILQVKRFNYLGNQIAYENDRYLGNELNKFQSICGTTYKTRK